MHILADLTPRRKGLVFDLVEAAGLDMTDWLASSKDKRGPKANPKYCYEWAFVEPAKLIILNLWHPNMAEEQGRIIERNNFRADAEFHRTVSHKSTWALRAERLDNAIQTALRENLPVRVIINDGIMRDKETLDGKPSKVTARVLDPEPWTISRYDWNTGEHEITRGILESLYVDQFDVEQSTKSGPERREQKITPYVRDPAVRNRVKKRSGGNCELCGKEGFSMESGALYLETHHIIPLSSGGDDDDQNVVALCADDHRRAHFSVGRDEMSIKLLKIAKPKPPPQT
jgi:5-methylcytosine-specific restriction enzyme A